jgi:serine phosphatase RsbU (regulator of sigma subunit)
MTPTGELFGDKRLLDVAHKTAREGATALLDAVEGAAFEFMESTVPADDLTMIAVKRYS